MDCTTPKILIFSNNCFSKTNSNGRTLSELFKIYPKNKIAQFYIQRDTPDFERCDNYFCLTDFDVLEAFLKKKLVGKRINQAVFDPCSEHNNFIIKTNKRTPLRMLLREMIWKSNRWKGSAFNTWVDEFTPNLVLVQAGDNAFILQIATQLAKERNIPLIVYNTEGYFFKKKNYMKKSVLSMLFFPIFRNQFRRQFKKTMDFASCAIYNCEMLKNDYDNLFTCRSYVLYNSSDIEIGNNREKSESILPVMSYLGNLGVGRYEVLIEIANTIQKINPLLKLDIYGKLPTEDIGKEIMNCTGISYKGFVQYDEVVSVMKNSDVLFHVENFSAFYREDLKYAFSTKIADCLKSGTCFFYYAPKELASTQYLIKNDAACVVTNKEDLEIMLRRLITDTQLRDYYINNALRLAEKNHSTQKNGEYIVELIKRVAHESATS